MNSPKVKEAINKVFEHLYSLSDEEFIAELEKHKDGEFGQMLLDSGFIDMFIKVTKF